MPRLRLDPFSPSGVCIVADSPRAKQQNGYVARTEKLSQISDVDALSPSNGQALAYNSTTKTWRPTTISGSTGGTGSGDVTSPGGTGNAGFVPLFGNDGGTTLVKSTIDNTGGGLAVDGPITSKGSGSNYSLANAGNQQVFNVATGSSVLSGGTAPYANMMLDGTTYLPLIVLDEVAPTAITTDQQYAGASLLYQDNTDHKLKVAINGGTIDNVATEGYVAAHAGTPADATTTAKGVIELAGDLAGTATAPTVTNLHLAADTAIGHKLTSVTDPTNAQDAATKNYVDSHTSGVSDATTTTKGIVQLAGDLAGTAALPTVPGLAGKVATTTTVNGHVLSSNVTISASDLTTGTLPVAQGGTGATATTGSGNNVLSTSPSLTTPKADIITDTNGGKEIELVATASSANWVKLTNTVAGSGVTLGVNGTGTNENLTLAAMGTGTVQVGGSQVTTATNTQTVTNKTMSGASNTFSAIPESAVTNLTTDLAAKATDTAVVHLANSETISGTKTFSSGTLRVAGATSGTVTLNTPAVAIGTLTLPSATDTLVGQATIDTLSNKTLTSPTITTPTITQSVATITAATTLTTTSAALQYANATTAAFTVTLPTTTTAGISFTIVKTDSSANAVTVAGTINGATNYVLTSQWSYIQVVSTTTSGVWYIVDSSTAANVSGTVAIANGGTGLATLPAGILKGAGTGTITALTAPTGAIVGTTDTQTLSAKTLTSPVINTGTVGADPTVALGIASKQYVDASGVGASQSFANISGAGGTFYYAKLGAIKMLWGQTAQQTIASAGDLSANVGFPTSFFTTVQSAQINVVGISGYRNWILCDIEAVATTGATVNSHNSGAGSAVVAFDILIIGT